MYKRLLNIIVLLIVAGCASNNNAQIETPAITVGELQAKIDSGAQVILIDVRTEAEYNGTLGHIDSTLLIPIDELEDRLPELEIYRDREIVVICRSGNRSNFGTKMLVKKGFNAVNMTGGMLAWNQMMRDGIREVEN